LVHTPLPFRGVVFGSYLQTLTSDQSPEEAIVFSAVSKYLQAHRNKRKNTADDEGMVSELDKYFTSKAKVLQPHVIADYAAGNRLIGLTEKQLRRGLQQFAQGRRDTHASPYASMPCYMHVSTIASPDKPRARNRAGQPRKERLRVKVVLPHPDSLPRKPRARPTKYRTPTIHLPAIQQRNCSAPSRKVEIRAVLGAHRYISSPCVAAWSFNSRYSIEEPRSGERCTHSHAQSLALTKDSR
jgi:hypothetical protein